MDSSSAGKLRVEAEIDAAITAQEEEIQRSKAHILDLRRRRNGLQPACRLPNELLGEIFHHVVQTSVGYPAQRADRWPRPWLTLTHVCEHWRKVAIGHHALWTCIQSARSHQLANMFAERADNCALKITTNGNRNTMGWHDFFPSFVAAHASRIGSLNCLQLTHSRSATISTLLGPEPRYEVLKKLDFCARYSPDAALLLFPPKALPSLNNLCCSGVPQSFIEALPGLKLTTLLIAAPADTLSASTWINVLQGLDALESLTLYSAFELFDRLADLPPMNKSALAHLPHLKTLSLEESGPGFTLSQVVEHLVFPASTTVDIVIEDFSPPEILAYSMSSLAAIASGRAPNKMVMPPFVSCVVDGAGVKLWRTDRPVAEHAVRDAYSLIPQGVPDWRVSTDLSQNSLQPILTAFSIFPLRSLAVDLPMPSPTALFRALAHFPSIRALFVNGRTAVEAFAEVQNAMWATPERHTLLPNLELLSFGNVAWLRHNIPSLQAGESPPVLAQRLEAILETRNTFVAPLKRLKLPGSTALGGWDPMSLAERNIVGKVEVDDMGWGVDYLCECQECQIYMAEMATEDEVEEDE